MAEEIPVSIYKDRRYPDKVITQCSGLVYGFSVPYKTVLALINDRTADEIAGRDGPVYSLLDRGVEKFLDLLGKSVGSLSDGVSLHMSWSDEADPCPDKCVLGVKYPLSAEAETDLLGLELASAVGALTPANLQHHIATRGGNLARSQHIAAKYEHVAIPRYSRIGAELAKAAAAGVSVEETLAKLGLDTEKLWKAYFSALSLRDKLQLTALVKEMERTFGLPAQPISATFVAWQHGLM